MCSLGEPTRRGTWPVIPSKLRRSKSDRGDQLHQDNRYTLRCVVISVLRAFPGHRDRHGESSGTSFKIQKLKDRSYCLLPKTDFLERCLYNCLSSTFQKKEFLLHIPHLSKMHCPEEREDPEASSRRLGHSFHQSSMNVTLMYLQKFHF